MVQLTTRSAEATNRLGARLGEAAVDGDIICLSGDLGAGKTTLAQGIAAGLGVGRRVTSPTFTLVQEYDGRLKLYHLDCYRLESGIDLLALDAWDWLGREGLSVVEWPERVREGLPEDALWIRISIETEGRVMKLEPCGPASARLLTAADL